ncbi:hypothetical protein BRADI_4g27650v3 [Brachypodium distachyon]|uniref:Uncharacterized protein n=1 Tax=Brachypodium distachyon TaxID=15368 RepID=I1IP87_BRADI|nr:hypothetical protein BRADI_4g27650v3 [Brachypodium distachyon]
MAGQRLRHVQQHVPHIEEKKRQRGGGYTFTVGYHELTGTKVTLKKPLLVLRKKKKNAAEEVELEVIGVIRHKILFKDRPKALISKPPTKEKALPAATIATPSSTS